MRVGVVTFPGSNCDEDAVRAVARVGATPVSLWHKSHDLQGVDLVILPGGFSYGDYLRAGAIAAISPAAAQLRKAASDGMPILGSCNGFQILCEIGLLPGALVRNRQLEFRCDWVHLRIESDRTPFTADLAGEIVRMPIAHGEGCWVADELTLARIEANGQVVFRYTDARGAATPDANPNGSTANIAGIANDGGNVVGLMPHPERCSEELLGGTDGRRILLSLAALTGVRRTGMAPASVQ